MLPLGDETRQQLTDPTHPIYHMVKMVMCGLDILSSINICEFAVVRADEMVDKIDVRHRQRRAQPKHGHKLMQQFEAFELQGQYSLHAIVHHEEM